MYNILEKKHVEGACAFEFANDYAKQLLLEGEDDAKADCLTLGKQFCVSNFIIRTIAAFVPITPL